MNILALDTSMGVCSAAVLRTDDATRALFLREAEMLRGHAEALMPIVEVVLHEARLTARDLDRIAATVGPGSFTGVRIAIAAARGLALVSDADLFGTDSLTVMARSALQGGLKPGGPLAIAVDARRGMLYLGVFDETGARISGPALVSPEDAVRQLPATLRVVAGNGGALLAEAARETGHAVTAALPTLQPGAAVLAALASESADAVEILRPLYLRPPDAKPQAAPVARQ